MGGKQQKPTDLKHLHALVPRSKKEQKEFERFKDKLNESMKVVCDDCKHYLASLNFCKAWKMPRDVLTVDNCKRFKKK